MSKQIALVTTGSRMFQTHFENSDKDMISIHVEDWDEAFDNKPGYKFENNTSIYELNQFMRELLNGTLSCHQVLWTGREFFKRHTDDIHIIVSNRIDLINRNILEYWVNLAEHYFGKAVRLGTLKLENKTILDYLYFLYTNYADAPPRTIQEVVINRKLDPFSTPRQEFTLSNYGLFDAGLGENTYRIYEDYAASKHTPSVYPGIINEKGELLISDDVTKSSRSGFKGVVWYDKRGFETYTRIKNQLELGNVKSGYAPKSMYHAFRTLECVDQFLRYNVLPSIAPNPTFLKSIRTHQVNLEDLKNMFKNQVEQVRGMLQEYTGPTESNTALAKDIILKIKGSVIHRRAKVPYASVEEEVFSDYGG